MNNHIQDAAMTFMKAIKRSEEYQKYEQYLTELKAEPELYEKVNEFRKKNFEIQNSEASENLMERVDELEREYAALLATPLVEKFLAAELAFCRMIQELDALIAGELDFQ